MEPINLSNSQRALLCLLRCALWQREPEDVSMLQLSRDEWMEVLYLAVRQAVAGLMYGAMPFLSDDCRPPKDILLQLTTIMQRQHSQYEGYTLAQKQLLLLFEEHDIQPVVLKGLGVAHYYPHPEQRKMGDIDLFFRSEDDECAARQILQEHGVKGRVDADRAYAYVWQRVCVEHHPFLYDVYRPRSRRVLCELPRQDDAFSLEQDFMTPSAIPCLLLLNTHILKHALGHGIGLRQLCDLAMAYRHFHGTYDVDSFNGWIDNLKLNRWTTLLHDFCVRHLGLDEQFLPRPAAVDGRCDQWLKSLLQSGDFGKMKRQNNTRGMGSKVRTMNAYLGNLSFALRYAPCEYASLILTHFSAQQIR